MAIAQSTPSADLAGEKAEPARRKQSREERRTQLIEATIETIALRGYARTTLSEVARTAGLSHGLVNFHFETKEKLLEETLAFLAEEYRENWMARHDAAAADPASQLDALIHADFEPAICTPSRLSAWCAFWGEAQSRPLYQERYGANDEAYNRNLENVCARLMADGGYSGSPERIGRVIRVTIEGVWLDMMTMRDPYPREEGLRTVHTCAAAFFPRHFNQDGLIG